MFVTNAPTCSGCGLMVDDCVCDKVGNQTPEKDFAPFGDMSDQDYIDELLDDEAPIPPPAADEKDFAPFGLPHEKYWE